jgi:hypothetical protein
VVTKDSLTNEGKGNPGLTESAIRKAVNAELMKEGWQEAKNRPDVLLNCNILVEKQG